MERAKPVPTTMREVISSQMPREFYDDSMAPAIWSRCDIELAHGGPSVCEVEGSYEFPLDLFVICIYVTRVLIRLVLVYVSSSFW